MSTPAPTVPERWVVFTMVNGKLQTQRWSFNPKTKPIERPFYPIIHSEQIKPEHLNLTLAELQDLYQPKDTPNA